jgi:dTDP-4-amino-4,6-dideoxygalactose transaminase
VRNEIPFNRPRLVGNEHAYIDQALMSGKLSGNGPFARRCAEDLERRLDATRVLITPSCTAALEMAGILANLGPGDEVIVPTFTFVSAANAIALWGAVPVFVDSRPDTLNVDPSAVARAITPRTKAIIVVHYGGVACEMEQLRALADEHGLTLIEDAAHSLPGMWNGRPLGSIGHLSTFSFHETKNVHCGEGGALAINDPEMVARAEIVQEKGTDRSRFFRGEVDKYTWQDIGSSYLLSEVCAAFLWAQLEQLEEITDERRAVWSRYHEAFEPLEEAGILRRPVVPDGCEHSGHLYYLLMRTEAERDEMIARLGEDGVRSVFHYVPLHDSPAGSRFGRVSGSMSVAESASSRLLRLPLWSGIEEEAVDRVIDSTISHGWEIGGSGRRDVHSERMNGDGSKELAARRHSA